ncbi:response regulator transcription factor [Pontibacter akesuensis]|uniref:Two component transcriptional regulator, LuxR family n=1 Tax=Pontibacter akesuensis TaxID=388950 RepID=A0A1I7KKV2_9BACT|nr:response regulator transcription factor [Pontibacter akesuensis]GHA78080.1 DNA-binding response regulator [Pontibacter akesuensis]SFU98072.1 two component transcriptional regulator, LuxR family [Pontibacter akesuensis]
MSPIRVLVADANLLIRKGLSVLLEQQGLEVVAEAESEAELMQLVQQHQPNVVLLDCNQPGLLEVSKMRSLTALSPNTHLLIITDDCSKETVLGALEAGATGYVLKLCGEQEILYAVQATARGERSMCSHVLESVFAKNDTPQVLHPLSARETEIIQLIAEGKSTMEIADTLFLSHHTINSHRKNILRKLQIKSPAEMIVKALDLGIIKPSR